MNGVTEEVGRVATSVTEKLGPMALALVVINVLYLAAGGWFLASLGDRAEKRDALLVKLASRECPAGPIPRARPQED
jgi:hypothetical protein